MSDLRAHSTATTLRQLSTLHVRTNHLAIADRITMTRPPLRFRTLGNAIDLKPPLNRRPLTLRFSKRRKRNRFGLSNKLGQISNQKRQHVSLGARLTGLPVVNLGQMLPSPLDLRAKILGNGLTLALPLAMAGHPRVNKLSIQNVIVTRTKRKRLNRITRPVG